MKRKAQRGFSLVELLTVTAILGILASVAGPTYRMTKMRAKESERSAFIGTIEREVMNKIGAGGHFPNQVGNESWLDCPDNPTTPEGPHKRYWTKGLGHWGQVFEPSSSVYFTYNVQGYNNPGVLSTFMVTVTSDLDSDGVPAVIQRFWSKAGTAVWTFTETRTSIGTF